MTSESAPAHVVFRCDADHRMGGGHAMRCLTLANALSDLGAKATFVAAAMPETIAARICERGHRLVRIPAPADMHRPDAGWEAPPLSRTSQLADALATQAAVGKVDWLVIDHYLLDVIWHSRARRFTRQILVIDDLANRNYDCDLLLDQTFGRTAGDYRALVPHNTQILTGSSYALLRREFAEHRAAAIERRKNPGPIRRVLVSMGTGDPGALTAPIVREVLAAAQGCVIDVVVGAHVNGREQVRELAVHHPQISVHLDSRRIAELMSNADIAVGASGMMSWERCCLGLPSIILVVAENQRKGAEMLAKSGAALLIGRVDEIRGEICSLLGDAELVARMMAAAFAIADGFGARRVVHAILDKSTLGELVLRPATLDDGEQLWLWRNDPVTRAQSRTSVPITWAEHIRWLAAFFDRPGGKLYLAERDALPVGVVRFEPLAPRGYEISIAVAPEMRGSGCGKALLEAGCAHLPAGPIYASVRHDNAASRRLFASCGFERVKDVEPGFLRYALELTDDMSRRRNGE